MAMQPAPRTIVYLHGFISSPGSAKAVLAQRWFARYFPETRFCIPALPPYPRAAVHAIEQCLQAPEPLPGRARPAAVTAQDAMVVFIGSSLGGFYANYFAERIGCRAVLVNPAVFPHRLLAHHLGEQSNPYTGERFTLQQSHMRDLRELLVENMNKPANRLVLLQTGDETLDYREAARYFAQCDSRIEQGGDHSFRGFENWLPKIAKFLGFAGPDES